MKDFKFLQTNKIPVLNMDWYNNYVPYVPQQGRPHNISVRHWNLLPQDIRNNNSTDEMLIYIQGWETPRNRVVMNPYLGNFRLGNIWTRGWHDRQRRNSPRQAESDNRQIHSFYIGIHNTQLRLEYHGDMDIDSVDAMIWDLKNRYRNYVSINQQVIGFMQNFLNEHLQGTSILRFA